MLVIHYEALIYYDPSISGKTMFRVNQLIFKITNFKNNFQKLLVVSFQRNRLTQEGSYNLAFDYPIQKSCVKVGPIILLTIPKIRRSDLFSKRIELNK